MAIVASKRKSAPRTSGGVPAPPSPVVGAAIRARRTPRPAPPTESIELLPKRNDARRAPAPTAPIVRDQRRTKSAAQPGPAPKPLADPFTNGRNLPEAREQNRKTDPRTRVTKRRAATRPATADIDPRSFDPNRELDWRFRRILDLLARPKSRATARDDAWVRRGLAFFRRHLAGDDRAQVSLRKAEPDLFAAYELYQSGESDFDRSAILQARLLAGQSSADIGAAMRWTSGTIEAYEALWFNIHDRLEARDWIVIKVFVPDRQRPSGFDDHDGGLIVDAATRSRADQIRGWLKVCAYGGGPLVIEPFVRGFPGGRLRTSADIDFWLDTTFPSAHHRATVAGLLDFDRGAMAPHDILMLNADRLKIEKRVAAQQQSRAERDASILTILRGLARPSTCPATGPV